MRAVNGIILTVLALVVSSNCFIQKPITYRPSTKLDVDLINEFPISTSIAAGVGLFGLAKFISYWKMQFVTASVVSGIPEKSNVVEFDVKDGKNIFYLSRGCDYTAIMSAGDDPAKKKEKMSFNERLILESIGKSNVNNLGLSGKVRERSQEIPTRSADCILSVGALHRSADDKAATLQEIYRILRPGGLFVFIEPESGSSDTIDAIKKVFPLEIKLSPEAQKAKSGNINTSGNTENRKDKKSKKSQKKGFQSTDEFVTEVETILNENTSNTSVSTTTTETTSNSTTLIDTSDLNNYNSNSEGVFQLGGSSSSGSSNIKPGLVYEEHNNIIEKYVSGIAVRPY